MERHDGLALLLCAAELHADDVVPGAAEVADGDDAARGRVVGDDDGDEVAWLDRRGEGCERARGDACREEGWFDEEGTRRQGQDASGEVKGRRAEDEDEDERTCLIR